MTYEDLNFFPTPERIILNAIEGDTRVPYERIKAYDDKEFELFIREWVVSLSDTYEVRGFGGAGDKGRDVIAKDNDNTYIYFQCKHYDHALTPSDIIPEFGKLIYYTYSKEIPTPKKYYILAPFDIGASLSDLIDKPEDIANLLIEKWDACCKNKIRSKSIELTEDLEEYIKKFDFTIIKTKTMLEVVDEHKKTAFYAFRFGGGLTVKRNLNISVPENTQKYEVTYIMKMLDAISDKEGKPIMSLEQLLQEFPQYISLIKINRERYFYAENLKSFVNKNFLSEECFKELTLDIYYGIYDAFFKSYENGYDRLLDVMTQVTKIDLQHNLLAKYNLVHPQDRQGMCHHLANERDEVKWMT